MLPVYIEFVYLPVINFAMQQNRASLIRSFTIENVSGEILRNVRIELTAEPEFLTAIPYLIEEIPVDGIIRIVDLKLELSSRFFVELTERFAGNISIDVWVDNEKALQKNYPVDILAFDQWGGISILPEMLSAFVTPNHPAISPVLRRAAIILEQLTGSSALNDYQSRNPNRVKHQMVAIYNAIAEQDIIYSSIPPSFEKYGQRIRLVENVLSKKMGTCLDMALLYATCLEAVGINPLIVVTKGHAFAGAWLVPDTFPDSITDDYSFLTKRTAEGINEMLLVETTCMNRGSNVTFDQAVQNADSQIGQGEDFILALDIKRSRLSGIRPLPQRISNGEHWEISEDELNMPEKELDTPLNLNPYDLSGLNLDVQVTKQLMWERKLLDLSLRNNLLNTRITRNTLQIISTDIDKFEDALADGNEFRLLPKPVDWNEPLHEDAGIYRSISSSSPIINLIRSEIAQGRLRTYKSEMELDKSLKQLYRSSRLSIEENGANTLYIALGLLRWYETPSSEQPRFAPILLLPVEMIRKSAARGYIIRSREEDVLLNITLIEMLRQNFSITIPGMDPIPTDESGVNVRLIFSIFRNSIRDQPKWDIEEQAIVGIFSFNKFIMWNDIHNNADKLKENDLVRSLINGKIEFAVDNTISDASFLDKNFTAADIVLPINADSSQLEAIYDAINDKSYILHGPPGTGKSQTITNIIANALYHGKRVLFVAEKMAALSVVYSRLKSIGLDPFCLEIHSNKAKKSDVLSQLRMTTEVVKQQPQESFERESKRLFNLRKELNVYIDALHKIYPFGYSLYQAITEYLQLDSSFEVKFPVSLFSNLTHEKIVEWGDAIDLMESVGKACGHPHNHPLSGINQSEYTPDTIEVASSILKNAEKTFVDLKESWRALDGIVGNGETAGGSKEQMGVADTLFTILLRIPELTPALLKVQNIEEVFTQCKVAIEQGKTRDQMRDVIASDFRDTIFEIDVPELLEQWSSVENKWVIPRFFGKRKLRTRLTPYLRSGTIKEVEVKEVLESIQRYQQVRDSVSERSKMLQPLFGKYATPSNEQWDVISEIINEYTLLNGELLRYTKDFELAENIKNKLSLQLAQGIEGFRIINESAILKYKDIFSKVDAVVNDVSTTLKVNESEWMSGDETWVGDAINKLNGWFSHIDKLKDWSQWINVRNKMHALEIGFVADEYKEKNIPTTQLKVSFYKSFYRGVIEYILRQSPELDLFNGVIFNDTINKYKQLKDDFTAITQKELYAKLAAKIPSFTLEATQNSEVGILQRNIRSNGRGTSIRSLFDQIPTLLSRLAPCMLMSPISVAQYLKPDVEKFDLVIFDEASQMPTYEAVGAIARGKSMIVVGDPKQMPPTNFFSVNTVDEDNLDKEDLESILDDSLSLSIPSRYLLWHYRSKHESLIAFSNSEYYDNKLLTFPSPDNIESKVQFVSVKGIYDKGKSRQNRAEAVAIVKEIERRLSNSELRKKSIGVVSFSSAQQNLIDDLLSELFVKRSDLESIALENNEPLFIKNLENVQGDERDIILFSVGYGPDKDGRVSMNFGPLNRLGGERRLNVAVSRARYEMIVFSTLHSDQIDLNRTSAAGVSGLKRFLEFAEKGGRTSNERVAASIKNSSIEHVIAQELRNRGHNVHTGIGTSGYKIDIGIVDKDNPGRYILGILCDGENYKQSKTTRDREIMQKSVLSLLGWNICRVWTLDWWENPSEVLDVIESAIEKAKKQSNTKKITPTVTSHVDSGGDLKIAGYSGGSHVNNSDEVVEEEADFSEHLMPRVPYTPAILDRIALPPEEFHNPLNRELILQQIKLVLHAEAPISRTLLCKRVLSAWGISRLGSRINDYFEFLLQKVPCYLKRSEGLIVYWESREQMLSYNIYRTLYDRNALDLPPDEVACAIKNVLESLISIPTKDLSLVAAKQFGFARTGTNVDAAMYLGMHEAVNRGYIKIKEGRAIIV